MERTNKIYVVGTLTDIRDLREGEKDGKKWIAGTAVVSSNDSEIELKYFSLDTTKDGAPNKRYKNYTELASKIGGRVKVNGELSGRVFYNESTSQIINFNEVSAGFFNDARPTDEDVATFEFGGFVVKPIHERLDKEEKLIAYEFELGQANFNGDNMQIVRFTVDKDERKIIDSIQRFYTKGSTVFINGNISYKVSLVEKVEEVAFGEPIVKSFQSTIKSFIVTGGKQPIVDTSAYSADQISKLESAYKAYLEKLETEAKSRSEKGATAQSNGPSSNSGTDRLL